MSDCANTRNNLCSPLHLRRLPILHIESHPLSPSLSSWLLGVGRAHWRTLPRDQNARLERKNCGELSNVCCSRRSRGSLKDRGGIRPQNIEAWGGTAFFLLTLTPQVLCTTEMNILLKQDRKFCRSISKDLPSLICHSCRCIRICWGAKTDLLLGIANCYSELTPRDLNGKNVRTFLSHSYTFS